MKIDHIVVAAPDLHRAKTEFAEWTGTSLADGGPHLGGGTCNALGSFGAGVYLEVIAPDRTQNMAGTNGERFATLEEPVLLHWAVRTDNLEAAAEQVQNAGFEPRPIRDMTRITPDGVRLQWQLMGVSGDGHSLGGLVPFFIDWQDSPHPADSAPLVGPLTGLSLPGEAGLKTLLAEVQGVEFGASDGGMRVDFAASTGTRGWRESAPEGFRF